MQQKWVKKRKSSMQQKWFEKRKSSMQQKRFKKRKSSMQQKWFEKYNVLWAAKYGQLQKYHRNKQIDENRKKVRICMKYTKWHGM